MNVDDQLFKIFKKVGRKYIEKKLDEFEYYNDIENGVYKLSYMPDDIIWKVGQKLDFKDLANFIGTSKTQRSVLQNDMNRMKKYFDKNEFKTIVQNINEDNFKQYLINPHDIQDGNKRLALLQMMVYQVPQLPMERRLWIVLLFMDYMYQIARVPEFRATMPRIVWKVTLDKTFDIEKQFDEIEREDQMEILDKFRKSKGYPFLKQTFKKLRELVGKTVVNPMNQNLSQKS